MPQISTRDIAAVLADQLDTDLESINFDVQAWLESCDRQLHNDIDTYLGFMELTAS